jgi:hypothetical protein
MDAAEAATFMSEKVGPELYAKAASEVDGCIPPWAKEGIVKMDVEAIRALMIAGWLRGWGARNEALS